MRRLLVVLPAAVLLLAGCQRGPTTRPPATRPEVEGPAVSADKVLKIKVTSGGDVTADGEAVTLGQLATRLAALKQAGGVVWYYRENQTAEPHPNAIKVIEQVAQNKLPIRLSMKPDYSDAVGDQGVSHPGR